MAEIKAFTLRNIPITPRAIVLFEHDGTKRLFSHEVEIARISPCGELQKVARAPYGNKVGDFLLRFIKTYAAKTIVDFMPTDPSDILQLWDVLPDDCFLDREIVQNALY